MKLSALSFSASQLLSFLIFLLMGLPIHIILQAMEDSLKPLCLAQKGTTEIAADPAQAISLLMNAPEKWRCIIGVDNEAAAETEGIGVSDTTFYTIVQAGVGLSAIPGDQIHRNRANNSMSMLEIAELVRSWVRGLQFVHEALECQYGFKWQNSGWVTADQEEGTPLRFGRRHDYILQHNIEDLIESDPATINWPPA